MSSALATRKASSKQGGGEKWPLDQRAQSGCCVCVCARASRQLLTSLLRVLGGRAT